MNENKSGYYVIVYVKLTNLNMFNSKCSCNKKSENMKTSICVGFKNN